MSGESQIVLSSTLDLASRFSNCVEALGLIHPKHTSDRQEQHLLTKLGIEQARLLVWGSTLGVTSPPAWVATHMVPSHPSATNPEPDQAVYFDIRDARLDNAATRKKIESALTDVLERTENQSRDQMMQQYGLKPSKIGANRQPALDFSRLEAFYEKYTLLLDLADASSMSPPRRNSIVAHSWTISEPQLFSNFVDIIRTKIDELIGIMDVKDRVDRAVKLDIKALGWHPVLDRAQSTRNMAKLNMIREACRRQYPEYAWVTQQALDNINDRWKGSHGYDTPDLVDPKTMVTKRSLSPVRPAMKQKSSGFLSFIRPKTKAKAADIRVSASVPSTEEVPRSRSDAGPINPGKGLETVRSMSLSDLPPSSEDQSLQDNQLFRAPTATTEDLTDLDKSNTFTSMISRHDQWKPM